MNKRYEDGRDCEVCNLDEGNQPPKDQEDLTIKPLGNM